MDKLKVSCHEEALVFTIDHFTTLFISQEDGVPIWKQEDPRRDAEAESAGAQSGHEGTGPGEIQTGAAGEEDHRWH